MGKTQFIDIHSHFVFGVDDGAYDLNASMAMLEQAASLNFKILLATPHATELTDDEFNLQLLNHFKQVKEAAQKEKLHVELFLAAEMFFSHRIFDWFSYSWSTFNNNGKYFLFELPLFDLPEGVGEFIFQARLKGLVPILAHPERYRYLHDKIDKLLTFVQQGCLIQINAGSIVGQFGSSVQSFAFKLIKSGMAHFVASDAHETESRSYLTLVQAREELTSILDDNALHRLFWQNPLNAIQAAEVHSFDLVEEHLMSKPDKWKKLFKNLKNRLLP